MSDTLTDLHTHADRLREEVSKVREFAGERIEAYLTLAHMGAIVLASPEGIYDDIVSEHGFNPLDGGSIRVGATP